MMNISKLDNILFFLIIFLSTLRITSPLGIYLLSIFLPIFFTIISLALKKRVLISASAVIIVSIVLLNWLGFYLSNNNSYLIINDKQYILVIAMIFISSSYLKTEFVQPTNININSVFTIILIFHIITFLLQFSLWYGFSYDLDFGTLTEGNPHRAFYYGGMFRTTGIFEEPSIYCAYIFTFLTIRYLLKRNNDLISYIAIITMILSFATIGIILSILYIIITNSKLSLTHIILSIIAFLFLSYYGGDYILMRLDLLSTGEDGSSNTKLFIIEEFFSSFKNFIFGYGLLYKEILSTKLYDGLGDMTLYLNSFIIFGMLGLCIPLIILFYSYKYYKLFGLRCCLLIIISFFKMASFHYPYFWFYFYLVIYMHNIFNHNNFLNKNIKGPTYK